MKISIHTPAKGVTNGTDVSGITATISIHTPAKGVTNGTDVSGITATISIHTPAKGVTVTCVRRYKNTMLFQSTLPRRE